MKMIDNTIKINCDTQHFLRLNELTEFQGDLKARDDEDVNKIVRSIKKYGFSFPFFVWKSGNINYIFDGHGRKLALQKLDDLGFLIPPLPVLYINAKDEKEAKDLLLRLNSHYGKMTKESVKDFIGDYDFDFNDYALPANIINFDDTEKPDLDFGDDDEDEKEVYQLVIDCETPYEMKEIYDQLKDMGIRVKPSKG